MTTDTPTSEDARGVKQCTTTKGDGTASVTQCENTPGVQNAVCDPSLQRQGTRVSCIADRRTKQRQAVERAGSALLAKANVRTLSGPQLGVGSTGGDL